MTILGLLDDVFRRGAPFVLDKPYIPSWRDALLFLAGIAAACVCLAMTVGVWGVGVYTIWGWLS